MMRRLLIASLAFMLSATTVVAIVRPAVAINPAAFNAGRIIDDALFYDPGGMGTGNQGVANIQAFLDAHVPACDTNGTRPSGYGNLTNAQYAQQVKGWPSPPYVCLDNYYENPSTGETSYEKGGGAFDGGISSARIIYNAAQDNRINPKVLLVLLRKESLNLFSDSWPMKSQYKYAMGYACPDSGPGYSANCDTSKAGFLKQVNLAAWQLRYYYDHMGSYNYAPGRWNTIQYTTNPSCGTKNVYIENYATASLYIYTPYTPNDAALNAYPGEAPCGAYGNRNFWFFWQEWFGSTLLNGNFLRTEANATVYLIGEGTKYPVSDANILSAASTLGGVGYTSQTYLDSIPTGQVMPRIVLSPDGTIYLYDANIKLPFTSCAMVSAYGADCGSVPRLTQAQINSFVTGPAVTQGMKTTSGKRFYMEAGTKREVLDNQSLVDAGKSIGFNTLTETAFYNLPYGNPIIRNSVAIQNRQDATKVALGDGSSVHAVRKSLETNRLLEPLSSGALDTQSFSKIILSGQVISDSVTDQSGAQYIITSEGKRKLVDTGSLTTPSVVLTTTLVDQFGGSGSLSSPTLLRSQTDSTVYAITSNQRRPLMSMEDLKSITGQSQPYIARVSDTLINSIQQGNVIIGAGRLVKGASSATVYVTDGYDKLISLSSFDPAVDIGVIQSTRTVSDVVISKYLVSNSNLSAYVSCGGINYVGMGGSLYQLNLPGKVSMALEVQACNVLNVKSLAPGFVRTKDGTIYQLSGETLRPITSWSTYQMLSSNGRETINISYSTLSLFTMGPPH